MSKIILIVWKSDKNPFLAFKKFPIHLKFLISRINKN